MEIPLFFTSDLTSTEKRVGSDWTLGTLKQKLEHTTGIQPRFQTLQYYADSVSNKYEVVDEPDSALVSLLGLKPYSRIHVADADPDSKLAHLYDENKAAEFQLSEAAYSSRADLVLQWKKDQQLGRYDPKYQAAHADAQAQDEKVAQSITVGARCRVINIEGERRGVVRFVGRIQELDEKKAVWVGVEFDEPVGKNDGLIGQVRVFQARPNHGSFVRPVKVEVGDFPEIDDFASDDEEL